MKLTKITLSLAIGFGSLAFGQTTTPTTPQATTMAQKTVTDVATAPATAGAGHKPNNTNLLVDRNGHTVSVTKVRRKHHQTVTKTVTGHRNKATTP